MLVLGTVVGGKSFLYSCKTQEEIAMFENIEDLEEPISDLSERKLVDIHPLILQSMENVNIVTPSNHIIPRQQF